MEDPDKLLERLRFLCSKSENCSADIYQKAMKALDWDREASRKIVESLIDDGYVDDSRFAAAFARDKAHLTSWGPVKISYALRGKGIGKEIISEAISGIDEDKAGARLESLLEAKYRTLQGESDAKLRLLKYALTRGYEYSQIEDLVNDIVAGKTNNPA